jgi:hypothetical protein
MYLSLCTSQIVFALRWSQNLALVNRGVGFYILVIAFISAFMVLFIWLIARRHKNWARWLWLVFFILGLPRYVKGFGQMLLFSPVAGILSVAAVLMRMVALVLIFTGNARGWFEQSNQSQN